MPSIYPMPINAPSSIISVTSTVKVVQLSNSGANNFVVLKNAGVNPVFVVAGDATVTATYPALNTWSDGTIMLPGEVATYSKDYIGQGTYISLICEEGLSSNIVVQVGQGV